MDYTKYLSQLGLSDKEAEIYLTLLKSGGLQATELAKKTGIKRTTVYPLLKSLIAQDMVVMYVVKNKQTFFAESPHKIIRLFEERLQNFAEIIPQLATFEKKEAQIIGIRFLESQKDLQRFYDDVVDNYKNKEIRILGNVNTFYSSVGEDFAEEYKNKRMTAGITSRVLLPASSKGVESLSTPSHRQVRFLQNNIEFSSTIDIYEDKVLIVSPEATSLALVIAVPTIVDVFRAFFDSLWQALPEEKS